MNEPSPEFKTAMGELGLALGTTIMEHAITNYSKSEKFGDGGIIGAAQPGDRDTDGEYVYGFHYSQTTGRWSLLTDEKKAELEQFIADRAAHQRAQFQEVGEPPHKWILSDDELKSLATFGERR